MTAIECLHQLVTAACPGASGVSIGQWGDKSSWRAFTDNEAEHARARAIFDAFDKASWDATQPAVKSDHQRIVDLEAAVAALSLKVDAK